MARQRGTAARVRTRAASGDDAADIAGLSGQLGYPSTVRDMKRRIEEICRDGNCRLQVAECDGAVVAWVLIHVYRLVSSDRIALVAGLVVDEQHRNQGIGALLMQEAEHWACERGCRGMMLRSRSSRKDAHNFYKRLGYARVKTQEVFFKELRF